MRKRDFTLAGVICIALTMALASVINQPLSPMGYAGLPQSMRTPLATSSIESGAGSWGSAEGTSAPPKPQQQLDITRTISGVTERGKFESTVLDLQTLAESYNGFIKNQILTYKDGSWSGTTLFAIPGDAKFTFEARQLIDKNGEVEYISQKMEDITGTGYIAKYSAVKIELKEKPKPQDFLTQFNFATTFLGQAGNLIVNWTLIIFPMFALSLVLWLALARFAFPLIRRVYDWSFKTFKKQNEKPPIV